MTDVEYFECMNKPLSFEEKQILTEAGWEFLNDEYIFIPNDYDSCMSAGIKNIRFVLLQIECPDLYAKYRCMGGKFLVEKILRQ